MKPFEIKRFGATFTPRQAWILIACPGLSVRVLAVGTQWSTPLLANLRVRSPSSLYSRVFANSRSQTAPCQHAVRIDAAVRRARRRCRNLRHPARAAPRSVPEGATAVRAVRGAGPVFRMVLDAWRTN